jgi:hypothetical protein
MVFDTKPGPLSVARRGPLLELDFPARPAKPAKGLAGLGKAPDEVLRSERMWLCVYKTPDGVIAPAPDHAALATAAPDRIIVTAPG